VNEHVTKRLADCSMRLGDMAEAERWYAVVVKFLNREPVDLYNYAEALKANGRYAEAEDWMDRYLAATHPDGDFQRSNLAGFVRKLQMDQARFAVRPVGINTPYADLAPAWLGSRQVVFSSSRNEPLIIERRAAWNGQPFLDLFVSDVAANGDLTDARPLPGTVNTRLHEGPATASANGDVIWFTRNNLFKGRTHRSQRGITRLAIFKARSGPQGFGQEEQFLYNNSEVSVAHPALSPDGRFLYFTSDMPGGFGGTDLYVCEDQGGQWGEPRNLGAAINTPYNESFPFIGADGSLFFASNGHPGLGGLDIMKAVRGRDGAWAGAINLGAPINSPRDDFGFIIDGAGKRGYFTSDRPGGKGDDDIYAFDVLAPLEERYLVSGVVYDDEHDTPMPDAEVRLLSEDGKAEATAISDAGGEYSFSVRKDARYKLVARARGRYDAEQHVSTAGIERQQIITRDLHLVADAGVWLRGVLRTKDGSAFVPGAKVNVVNLSSFYSESRVSGDGGDFDLRLQLNEEFEVLIEKPGYFSMSVPVSTVGMKQGIIDLNAARDLAMEEIRIGAPIPLKYIRWPQGGSQLDKLAKTELDGLAERMGVNPGISIEVAVHTDARGDMKGQQELSQQRAEAIAAYLRSKGVAKERVKAKGYGATRLVNECAPGVQCTEEQHAANRRNEWSVTAVQQ
jgi:hypothetical protein